MSFPFSVNAVRICVLGVVAVIGFVSWTTTAYAISSINGSASATSSVGVALPIADLEIVGAAASTTPVKLVVTNGTLTITDTGGLGSLSGTTGSTITFSATVADANTALDTLTYTRGSVGTDTLEVSLVDASEVFFSDNGHLYEYISSSGDWNAAETAAAGLTRYGATGYLTTITSQAENDFAAARLGGAGWMGASDAAVEGEWRWVTGPESGTQFWSGNGSGNTVGGNYANWAAVEPNDSGGEDCAQFLSGGSGEWNDLPCSGTNLAGYVVEFGAPGDMPTVVAKEVSLATVDAPTADTLVPADGATNVNGADNLQITFSEAVTTGTGTITIYRSSDDSVVEEIMVTGAQVTGSGTTDISINPTTDLADSTSYYVQVASTTFENASNVFYLGIADTTSWNFTTGDYTGPVFSSFAETPNTESVAVRWNTNEAASSRVVYGSNGMRNQTTAETDTAPRVTSHAVTLSGLERCTEYSYQVVGIDGSANSNSATSTVRTVSTSGCSSGSTATRVRSRSQTEATTEQDAADATNETSGASNTTLLELWQEERVSEAVGLLLRDTSVISSDTDIAVKVLRSYIKTRLATADTSAVAAGDVLVRDLTVGDEGEDVRRLQKVLIAANTGPAAAELTRVGATAYFGTYTKNALGEYQKQNGIVPYTGYFGAVTRAEMKAAALPGLWW